MTRKDSRNSWWLSVVGGVLMFALLVAVWHVVVVWFEVPRAIVPLPSEVLSAAIREKKTLSIGFAITAVVALTALGISIVVGLLVAMIFSLSRLLRSTFYPYVIFLQTVPIVAIAPLLVTWFGYGFQTIVLVAVIISLFPIISNVTAGLISVDQNLTELFRLNGASRWQIMWKLQIPFAVRSLILGARVSAGLAVIGAIIGEFFVGDGSTAAAQFNWLFQPLLGHELFAESTSASGLGTIIAGWQRMLRTDAMIAAIITSTLLGITVLGCVNLASKLFLRRWTEGQFEH